MLLSRLHFRRQIFYRMINSKKFLFFILTFLFILYAMAVIESKTNLDHSDKSILNFTQTEKQKSSHSDKSSIVDYFDTVDYDTVGTWDDDGNCPLRIEHRSWTKYPETFSAPNCSQILTHPKPSKLGANTWIPNQPHDDKSILELVKDCSYLKRTVAFASRPTTDEERAFPLAYIFVGQRNADQTLRLFRTIYWPQNAYCFTYDNKSTETYKNFMISLASCFPNVVINPNPINVFWGQDSVLYNVMNCFEPLANSSIPWKYTQVVSYNDFPLKTNLEMVKIMKLFNGSNDSDMLEPIVHFYYGHRNYKPLPKGVPQQKPILPHGLILFKGGYATTMTREFVRFVLDNPISHALYKWIEATWCPEEHYWATLMYNLMLKAPGGFPGQCLWFYSHKRTKKPYLSRAQVWNDMPLDGHKCLGKTKQFSCVYGVDDAPWLVERPEFIGHKFYAEFQPAALYCLEKWHWSKTCAKSTKYFDTHINYFVNLPNVRYQRTVNKDEFRC